MRSIYIIMTATGTWFSRCIGLYTRERYNHVSLCLDAGINRFYSFGRKLVWFPLWGGFVIERRDTGMFKAFGNTTCAIYRLDIDDKEYKALRQSLKLFVRNSKEYGYNLLGLIGVMMNIPLRRKNKFFCTQFVATMLQTNRIHDFEKDPSLVTPRDFYDIKGMTLVYEGRLCDYSNCPPNRSLAVNL